MGHHLLVIDDDPHVLEIVRVFMGKNGWSVTTAPDGGRGVALARRSPPDVILLDVQLPDMPGWEICQTLKADSALRSVPVVMLSGERKRSQDKVRGLELGAEDYLIKPFSLPVLKAKLEAVLRITKPDANPAAQ